VDQETNRSNTMQIDTILTAINSRRDSNGNVYYAFRFHDCATETTVTGYCGACGESNLYAIRRIWNPALDDWDRTMDFRTEEMGIRDFNRMIKGMEYAGSQPEEIAKFIRDRLPAPDPFADYVAKGGTECPFCRCGGNLHTGELSGPDSNATAYLNVKCLDCGKEWTDVYTLTGATPLENGD